MEGRSLSAAIVRLGRAGVNGGALASDPGVGVQNPFRFFKRLPTHARGADRPVPGGR
jgi:hypothetical protein